MTPSPTRIFQIKVTAVKAKSLSINICVVCLMRETQHQLHASDIHIHVAPARIHPPTILNIIATLMPSCTPCQIDRRKMSIAAYQKRRVFVLYTQFVQYIVYVGQIVPPPPLLFHSCSHASILPVPHELSLMDPSKIKKKVYKSL